MGLVFRAWQSRPERAVALKVIAPELAEDDDFRARFEREFAAAARIEHPNVIPVYEVGQEDELLFIVMRFVDGVDLGQLRRREGRLDPRRAVGLVAQIADALDAAHTRGLIHRDVKPGNVLVSGEAPDEHAYLTDFGITKLIAETESMTATGKFVGSLDYIAPEQLTGGRADARSDVYALGCVLYELVSGSVPFPRESDIPKMYAHLNEDPAAPSELAPGVPAQLDAVVARAMAKAPEQRYASAGELARSAHAATREPPRMPSHVGQAVADPYAATKPAIDQEPDRSESTALPVDPRPLVGRQADLDRLCQLLSTDVQLVTLVGMGGVGKTRLAIAAGQRLAHRFIGGACVVNLLAVRDRTDLLAAVAQSLGVRDVEGDPLRPVGQRLHDHPVLLILDNFEQILPLGAVVGELVLQTRTSKIIATSQAPLRIAAETVFRVDVLEPSAATELFLERAAAIGGGRGFDGDQRNVVEAICEHVGRLPLAIELAAARTRLFTAPELLARLEDSSSLLQSATRDAPERHQNLRATLEWTHTALTSAQQGLFRRMGVFSSPVPLSSVGAVAHDLDGDTGSVDVLEALEGLIDFSLIHREESRTDGLRFTMPQALRDYARQLLADAGEQDLVSWLHAEHVSTVADNSRIWYAATAEDQASLMALAEEVRPALEWAGDHDAALYRRLLAAVGMMLARRGQAREAVEHLTRALEGQRIPETSQDAWLSTILAAALEEAGRLHEAASIVQAVIAFARAHRDEFALAVALIEAAWIHIDLEDTDAVAAAEESLGLLRSRREERLIPKALFTLVQAIIFAGRLDEAERLLDEAASNLPQYPPDVPVAIATMRADIALERGDHAKALELYADSLHLAERLGDVRQVLNDAISIASLICIRGDIEAALEVDALVSAIARDAGHTAGSAGVAAARGIYRPALTKLRESTGATAEEAARRAAVVPANERVLRILALAAGTGETSHSSNPRDRVSRASLPSERGATG
jgi:non-specific serine/threonine protein kinase